MTKPHGKATVSSFVTRVGEGSIEDMRVYTLWCRKANVEIPAN
jgi:hypothetical protein